MATTAPEGLPPPPLPITKDAEDQLRAMLKNPVEITGKESEDVRRIKQKILDNRALLLSKLDEGYTIHDVLTQHQELLADNAKLREMVIDGLREYEKAGDEEGANMYREKMNKKLADMGLDPVYSSMPIRDKLLRHKQKREQGSNRAPEGKGK